LQLLAGNRLDDAVAAVVLANWPIASNHGVLDRGPMLIVNRLADDRLRTTGGLFLGLTREGLAARRAEHALAVAGIIHRDAATAVGAVFEAWHVDWLGEFECGTGALG
jgi:hypothetical protein